jgi:hypothetical protein
VECSIEDVLRHSSPGKSADVRQIGAALNVHAVLEGRVRYEEKKRVSQPSWWIPQTDLCSGAIRGNTMEREVSRRRSC